VRSQRDWGWDYLWGAISTVTGLSLPAAAGRNLGGTGGGFSAIEPSPSYREFVPGTQTYHAVEYLTSWCTHRRSATRASAYTGNPGQPYNPGSGLGYPDFGKLAADYASAPPHN